MSPFKTNLTLLAFCLFVPVFLSSYAPLVGYKTFIPTFTYSYFETEHFWNKDGKRKETFNHYERNDGSLDLEVGVTRKDDLLVKLIYTATDEYLNIKEDDFGDFEAGWKHAWRETGNSILSSQLTLYIPAGRYIPEIRYGEWGGEIALLYARSYFIKSFKLTLDGLFAYRSYSGFPSDQLRGYMQGWIDINPRWQLLTFLELDWGLFNGREPRDKSFIFYTANYRLLYAKIELNYYFFNKGSISAGYRYHIWGQNTGCGHAWYGNLAFCF